MGNESSNRIKDRFNNPILTRIYQGYQIPGSAFIRDQILPKLMVNVHTADGRKMLTTSTDILRIINNVRVGRSKTAEIEVGTTKARLYKTEEHSLKIMVTKSDGKDYSADWREGMELAKVDFTQWLKEVQMLAREKAVADVVSSASTFTNSTALSGSNQWNDYVNSNPKANIKTARQTVRGAAQAEINTAVMGIDVFEVLEDHPFLKKTNGVAPDGTVAVRSLTEAEVAKALGIDRLVIGNVWYDNSKFGNDMSMTQLWGKFCSLLYTNPSPTPSVREKSFGYSFTLQDAIVDEYTVDDPKDAMFIRVVEEYDDVILEEKAGYIYSTAIA